VNSATRGGLCGQAGVRVLTAALAAGSLVLVTRPQPAGAGPADAVRIAITNQALTPEVAPGGDATFRITVANAGVEALSGVVVGDALAPNCARTIGELAGGATATYTCTMTGVREGVVNVATVAAAQAEGGTVTAIDAARLSVPPAKSGSLAGTGGAWLVLVATIGAFAIGIGAGARRLRSGA
jgi:uncharacterized repeat protein (TIGR01451 family)